MYAKKYAIQPPGVLNCLTVAREQAGEVGLHMCHSPLFRKLSFTGSTAVGKWLMRESASTVKRVSWVKNSAAYDVVSVVYGVCV
jgi:acyl-CoA reductase-like NAD-dependent aldehyde dehydrogenase